MWKMISAFLFSLLICLPCYCFDYEVHGFMTLAYSRSDSSIDYDEEVNKRGEFTQGSKAGVQAHAKVSKRVDATLQLLASGRERFGKDFVPILDVGHMTVHVRDYFRIVAGKIRFPVWLISEYRQVGSLYPWINPPEEVYEIVSYNSIGANDTFLGFSLDGHIFSNENQELGYRFYHGGTDREDTEDGVTTDATITNLHGLTLDYQFKNLQLKASYLIARNESTTINARGNTIVVTDTSLGHIEFISTGIKFDNESVIGMGEFSYIRSESLAFKSVESFYIMAGKYLWESRFLLHATFAEVLNSTRATANLRQRSQILGFNYNYDHKTVFKIEWKSVEPTIAQTTANAGDPVGLFSQHPGRDVNIFSISVNTFF